MSFTTFNIIQNTVSGTDVMDYKEVDNEYGGLQDFRDLILAAQEMGMSNSLNLPLYKFNLQQK